MWQPVSVLILFSFLNARADLNDTDCVNQMNITSAESSWEHHLNCNLTNAQECLEPAKEKANQPFGFFHAKRTEYVAVLLHGLSDSPYYLKDIAYEMFLSGMNVIVPRLTGHGTCAEHLNHTYTKLENWIGGEGLNGDLGWALQKSHEYGDKIVIGGLSLGAVIATYATQTRKENFAGLVLFSPAFKLKGLYSKQIKLGAFFSSPLSRIYGGRKNFGNGVRYNRISVEASYQLLKLQDKLKKLKPDAIPSLPIFAAFTEYEDRLDLNPTLKYTNDILKGSKTFLFYGPEHYKSKRQSMNPEWILSDHIPHAGIVLKNAQWSPTEQNKKYSEFSEKYQKFLAIQFPNDMGRQISSKHK